MVPPLRYFLCLVLYNYTVNNDHTWCYILSAWFLDTRISTCLPRKLYYAKQILDKIYKP